MHELEEYGLMHVKLYEDIARHGQIATSYAYPVKVEGRYVMDPSPIPKFDNPKLSGNPAIQLFGAGREQRIYAVPPFTQVVSLDFDDHPFVASKAAHDCDLCGAKDSYLDEVITDDAGGRMFVCSDTDFCASRRAKGLTGRLTGAATDMPDKAPPPHPSPTRGEGGDNASAQTSPPPRGEGPGVGGLSAATAEESLT
jgi:alpha-D-ribose 1-methylphosphonate 5-phosphate C-P lyase